MITEELMRAETFEKGRLAVQTWSERRGRQAGRRATMPSRRFLSRLCRGRDARDRNSTPRR